MAILPALMLAGVPPVGLGVYARGHVGQPGPWRWYTGREWEFVGVESSAADRITDSFEAAVARSRAAGNNGVIIDPETPYGASDVDALAAAVRSHARVVRIGITSFPSWPGMERLARGVRGLAWGSPQLYYDAATNARGWQRWRGYFGLRMIPSVAGYVSGPITSEEVRRLRSTPEGYAEHLASVPRAGGAIVWPVWPMPQYMTDALARRYGGVGALLAFPHAAAAGLSSWPGIALAILALVLVLAMLSGGAFALRKVLA